jgi:HSP20 family protein
MALVRTQPRKWENYPWTEFEELAYEMEWLFKPSFGRLPYKTELTFSPYVDLIDTGESLVARVDLPGVLQENVDISIEGGRLTIRGQRISDGVKEENYIYHWRPSGRFVTTLDLPVEVNTNAIKAGLQQGVLEITMPKTAAVAPKKVALSVK